MASIELGQPDGAQPDGAQPGAITTTAPSIVRNDFALRLGAWRTHVPPEGETAELLNDFRNSFDGDALKAADESYPVRLRLYDMTVARWKANKAFAIAEVCRPIEPNGFAYVVSKGGTTGFRQPRFPTTLGIVVPDGSAEWTCIAAASNGISPITAPAATSSPAGLTISDVSVESDSDILATYAGGVSGICYEAIYTFTMDGLPRVARHLVLIA